MKNENIRLSDYVRNLYIKPNYAVLIPAPRTGARSKSLARIKNEENLKLNQTKGTLSEKSRKRLVNAINWLILASQKKRLYCSQSSKWVSFRLSFITLTIPQHSVSHSDKFYKSKILHTFLSSLYHMYGVRNYVWKAERHLDDTIHFHLTTDKYIHYSEIRRLWNQVLIKYDLLSDYQKKFSQMSEKDYIEVRQSERNFNLAKSIKAYQEGVKSNWLNPNSTDVHSVRGIRNLSAYLADYMAKKEVGKSKISGRQWGCSYSLSNAGKEAIEVDLISQNYIMQDLTNENIEKIELTVNDKLTNDSIVVGHLFFWKFEQLGKEIKRGLFRHIQSIVAEIRNPVPLFSTTVGHCCQAGK